MIYPDKKSSGHTASVLDMGDEPLTNKPLEEYTPAVSFNVSTMSRKERRDIERKNKGMKIVATNRPFVKERD